MLAFVSILPPAAFMGFYTQNPCRKCQQKSTKTKGEGQPHREMKWYNKNRVATPQKIWYNRRNRKKGEQKK